MDFYNRTDMDYRALVKHHALNPLMKVELLDQYEHAYSEITQDISSENQGSITQSLQQGVRSSISFTIFDPTGKFLPNPNDRFFWIGRKFKVYLGLSKKYYTTTSNPLIYSGDKRNIAAIDDLQKQTLLEVSKSSKEYSEDIYWFSKGVYIITGINASNSEGGKVVAIEGVDKFGAFTNDTGYNEMVGSFALNRGQKVGAAIREILRQDIGNGEMIDPIEPVIDPSFQDFELPLDIDKGPGSYVGELLTDLANMLHADIYYDENGRLNFWQSMSADEYKNVVKLWDFSQGDAEYISNSIQFDLLNVANSIYVVGDNPSAKTIPMAWSENNNPVSPLSIQKIGRKTRYIESSSIQTVKEAQDYADYILKTASLLGHTINFNCSFIPHLTLDGVITITDDHYDYERANFIVTSLTFPIGQGEVSIGASSIKELPEA